jgi:DNA-binding NarL/FixJ family response regulator
MKLLLAHRPGIFRELFSAFLRASHPLHTLEAVGDGIEFVESLEREAADMVIVETDLPGLDGISAVMEARRRGCRARAMILSRYGHPRGAELLRSLRAGVTAYLAPEDGVAEFRAAMQVMLDRGLYVSPAALGERDLSEVLLEAHHQAPPIDRLTTREKEVLQLVSEGLTSTEIASRLCISASTVDGYRARLMLKTRSHSVVDLLHWSQAAWSSN